MKHFFCWQVILIFLYLTSAWMFFFHTLECSFFHTAFPTSYHIKISCSCWVWKPSNNECLLNLVPSASFLTQSNWLEKKVDQSLYVRKEALGTRLMPTKTMVRAICKCVQKRLALLKWDWLIKKIQPLFYRKTLLLICVLGCVQGIMHFIIQSALLDCSFPILVCYSRPVYYTLNFQIIAIVLMSFVNDTFCPQLY